MTKRLLFGLCVLLGCTGKPNQTRSMATDSTQQFTNGEEFLEILPDGTIHYEPNMPDPPLEGPMYYNFNGSKVQMPGRRIVIHDPHGVIKTNWHAFRNSAGQALDEVFSIEHELK